MKTTPSLTSVIFSAVVFAAGAACRWSRIRRELWRGCRLSQKAHRCHRSSRQGGLGSINPYCHGVLSEFESRWIELDKTEDDFWIASFVIWAGFHPLYHCPFEIGLCSGKGGHGRLGRVETWSAFSHPAHRTAAHRRHLRLVEMRCAPLLKSKSKRLLV